MGADGKTEQELLEEIETLRARLHAAQADLQRAHSSGAAIPAPAFTAESGSANPCHPDGEDKFRTYIEYAPVAVFVIDRAGHFLEINAAAAQMLGCIRSELMGCSILDVLPAESLELGRRNFQHVLQLGKASGQMPLRRRDGHCVWIDAQAVLLSNRQIMVFCQDITERKQADEALRQSEERFRVLLDRVTNIAVQGYDPDGTVRYWNQASERIYGYTAAQALGRNLVELIIPPEMRSAVRDAIRNMVAAGKGQPPEELLLMRRDGSRVAVYSNHTLVQVHGRGPELYCIDIDLTERNRAIAALRSSEALFSTVFRAAPIGISICRISNGEFVDVNDAFLAMSGYTRADLIGHTVGELHEWISPEDQAWLVRTLQTDGALRDQEIKFRHKSGAAGDLLVSAETITLAGEPCLLCLMQDITQRKRAEAELTRRNQDLVILNAIAARISHARTLDDILNALLDVVLKLTQCQCGAVHLLDQEEGRFHLVMARGLPEELGGRLERAEPSASEIERAIESGQVVTARGPAPAAEPLSPSIVVPIRSKEQVLGTFCLFGSDGAVPDPPNTRLLTLVGNQVGVAIENAWLAEKTAQIEVWREMDRLRSELVANVSHELRTPLGLITLYSSSLLGRQVTLDAETHRQFLSDVVEEADKLTQIVDNLLDISMQQNNRLRLNRRGTDIVQLIHAILRGMSTQLAEHPLIYEGPQTRIIVNVDPPAIGQVMRNLLSNASKYSPRASPIRLGLTAHRHEIVLQVGDQGIGIPPEDLERIFERFYRVPNEATHTVRGVGLGLAISRGIVEAHGGRIWAESTIGVGSRFFVALPLAAPPSPAP